MIFPRDISDIIEKNLFKTNKVIVIYGPRQVGKTTLVKEIQKKYPQKSAYYSCDYPDVQEVFAYSRINKIDKVVKGLKLLILDEAQRIENIGLVLKILHDSFPGLQILATGSSSFELSNKINEPLTGRKIELKLYPLSLNEISFNKNNLEKGRLIENLLRFGSYPLAVLHNEAATIAYLNELTGSYLFKDVFSFQDLRKPELLSQLLRLLAFQISSEVSYQELAQNLKVDQSVVQRYIDLLEKSFVVFRLSAFSRNLRKEISKTRKIYFYDLGIRNTLIQNLNPLNLRDDIGALWENFCLVERLKHLTYSGLAVNSYFRRTYDRKEIDYIEESSGQLRAHEFKWQNKKAKVPKEFLKTYPGSTFEVVTRENYEDFVSS